MLQLPTEDAQLDNLLRDMPKGADPFRTDGSNDFAHRTMKYRIPENIRGIITHNPGLDPSCIHELEELAAGIEGDAPLPPPRPPAPDMDMWADVYEVHRRGSWLRSQWFFAETYAYRQVIRAVRYWETGFDPFYTLKREDLESKALLQFLEESMDYRNHEGLRHLLHAAVWGNRIDLSYAVSKNHGSKAGGDDLLIDDSGAASDLLLRRPGPVHIVCDNAGTELASDLLLCRELHGETDAEVVLHVKQYPTYVSDATARDVYETILYFRNHDERKIAGLGDDLYRAYLERRLTIAPDLFWNSAFFLSDLPERIGTLFQGSGLVIMKGDMNYRRCFSDTLWQPGAVPEDILPGIGSPLLFLRSLKSDALAGIDASDRARLDREDPEWKVNGKRGIIQLVRTR